MPKGPSIVLLKNAVRQFEGETVMAVYGNTKIEKERALHKKVVEFKSWGKHFLICFDDFAIRIHMLMFGTYRINERKETPVRLGFSFESGELNFYSCSVKLIEGDAIQAYDFTADVMSDTWNTRSAKIKLGKIPETLICDALLSQDIFAGVGNIIKNEVLYRVRVHPNSLTGKIPAVKVNKLLREVRNYSFDFLEWKKNYVLKKHWLAHTKKVCL